MESIFETELPDIPDAPPPCQGEATASAAGEATASTDIGEAIRARNLEDLLKIRDRAVQCCMVDPLQAPVLIKIMDGIEARMPKRPGGGAPC